MRGNGPIRIVIADDHHLVRTALANFLADEPDIQIVGQIGHGGELLIALLEQHQPDVLLLDVKMPNHDLNETLKVVLGRFKEIHILVLSQFGQREFVESAIEAGAHGYMLKTDRPDNFLRAIRTIARGEKWFSPELTEMLVRAASKAEKVVQLTPREKQVLGLMAQGCVNDEIATELVLSRQTVKNYVRNIFNKLGVKTRVEAVLYAIEHGLRADE